MRRIWSWTILCCFAACGGGAAPKKAPDSAGKPAEQATDHSARYKPGGPALPGPFGVDQAIRRDMRKQNAAARARNDEMMKIIEQTGGR